MPLAWHGCVQQHVLFLLLCHSSHNHHDHHKPRIKHTLVAHALVWHSEHMEVKDSALAKGGAAAKVGCLLDVLADSAGALMIMLFKLLLLLLLLLLLCIRP